MFQYWKEKCFVRLLQMLHKLIYFSLFYLQNTFMWYEVKINIEILCSFFSPEYLQIYNLECSLEIIITTDYFDTCDF